MRLIWAQSRGGVIGADGGLPWRLPEDLRVFRALTTGGTVVMGRRTWESLPERYRPLPGRRNVVLSSSLAPPAPDVAVVGDVAEVLRRWPGAWVVGGGQVYAAFLPHATAAVVTDVDVDVDGDTLAPTLDGDWRRVARTPSDGWATSASGLRFAVSVWTAGDAPETARDGLPHRVEAALGGDQ